MFADIVTLARDSRNTTSTPQPDPDIEHAVADSITNATF
jgi:hypothetical protein